MTQQLHRRQPPARWGSTTRNASTSIGCVGTDWAGRRRRSRLDKMTRHALLARGKDPVLWDFGSAVKHHKLYSRWRGRPFEDDARAQSIANRVDRDRHIRQSLCAMDCTTKRMA